MPKFKEGDKVVRIGPSKRNVIKGGVYIVEGPVHGTSVRGYIYLRDHGYGWDVCNFELYKEPEGKPVMTNETKKPHVHAECIKAWADGVKVQFKLNGDTIWHDLDNAGWSNWSEKTEYRIKPEPKPDVVKHVCLEVVEGSVCFIHPHDEPSNVRLFFDGETGKLKKAEVIG